MARDNIYNTLCVASVVPKPMLRDLVDFLIDSRAYVLPSLKTQESFKLRVSGHSIFSTITNRLGDMGKDQAYSLIRLPSKSIALREVVDFGFIPFDMLQLKDVLDNMPKTLSVLPELNDRMVINVTDLMKNNGDFSDVSQFQGRVVRDFLSRNYFNSKGSIWLSPTFVRYIAKVYNMTIGGRIARLFNLSPQIKSFIQTIFCLFFVGKMTSTSTAQIFVKTHLRQLGLGHDVDLVQIFAFIEDVLKKKAPETLFDVCQVIDAFGHDQMSTDRGSRLTIHVLNTLATSWYRDVHIAMIALEYPPYFAYLVMLALSNAQISLSFSMRDMNLTKEGHELFDTLLHSPAFLNSI